MNELAHAIAWNSLLRFFRFDVQTTQRNSVCLATIVTQQKKIITTFGSTIRLAGRMVERLNSTNPSRCNDLWNCVNVSCPTVILRAGERKDSLIQRLLF